MAWLTGWRYRKSHLIVHAANAGTLYQKIITVHKTTGTDLDDDIYVGSNCRDDFGDIRFTDDTGNTLLDCWMESYVSGTSAIFWVEIAGDLTTVDKTIYVYYSKADATTTSNIFNTGLTQSDDFEDNSLAAMWTTTVASGDTAEEAGGQLHISCPHNGAHCTDVMSASAISDNYVRFREKVKTASILADYAPYICYMSADRSSYGWSILYKSDGRIELYAKQSGFWNIRWISTTHYSASTWYIVEFLLTDTQINFRWLDATGALIEESGFVDRDDLNLPFRIVERTIGSSSNIPHHYVEWFFYAKYVNPEPAHSTWGSEVTIPTVTTQEVSSIEETTSTGNGNITATGGESPTKRGICWNTTGTPTVADSKTEESPGPFGTGAYTESMTSLLPGTLYYVRAYAYNLAGYGYGSQVTFTTKPNPPTSLASTAKTKNSISLSWNKGSGAVTTKIMYRTDQYPTGPTDGTQGYSDTGSSGTVGSLSSGQIYYFRAWSYNSASPSPGYSDDYSSVTEYTRPDDPSSLVCVVIDSHEIDLSWSKGTGGDKTMIRRKIGSYPTSTSDGDEVYLDTGTSYNNTGLVGGVHYYYRAWAFDTDSGYYSDSYSQDDDITTAPGLPIGKIFVADKDNNLFRVDFSTMLEEKLYQ